MDVTARDSATQPSSLVARLFASWQLQAAGVALAAAAFVMGTAPLERAHELAAGQQMQATAGIHNDASKAAREAKKAERAAAREAKKKERAAKSGKSDDRYAKAKPPKSNGGGSVDLGDDDPLEGL